MKTAQQKTTSGPITVKVVKRRSDIKTEGAFQDKVDKANYMLKIAGLHKDTKL